MVSDDHYYEIQAERSKILAEKETLENVYKNIIEEHSTLQTSLDDALAEKEDALTRLRELRRELDSRRSDRTDSILRSEIDKLRAEL